MPKAFDIARLDLQDAELPRLLTVCHDAKPIQFLDGEYLMREGERRNEIYLVLKGAFVVEQAGQGSNGEQGQTVIADHCSEEGEACFVGEMAYLGEGRRTASVRSSGATYAVELKSDHLEVILDEFPNLALILCKQFTQRLREANDILRRLTAERNMQTSQRFLEAGEVLVRQGDAPGRLYLVLYGDFQWERDGEPVKEGLVAGFVEPEAYFCATPYRSTVRATMPACLAVIEEASMQAVISNYPEMILTLLRARSATDKVGLAMPAGSKRRV